MESGGRIPGKAPAGHPERRFCRIGGARNGKDRDAFSASRPFFVIPRGSAVQADVLVRRGSGCRVSSSKGRPFGQSHPRSLTEPQEKTRSAPGLRVFGAGDRDRTGTMFPSADFKSAASANFATPTNFSAFSLPQPAGKCKGGAKKSGGAGQYDTVAGRCAIPAQEPPAAAYIEACLRIALGRCAIPAQGPPMRVFPGCCALSAQEPPAAVGLETRLRAQPIPPRDFPPRESHQSAPGALPIRAGSPRTPVCPKDQANRPRRRVPRRDHLG